MEQVHWYCLAYAAKLHGVLVHSACLMSTHCHEATTDVRGEYPSFLQTFARISLRPLAARLYGSRAVASPLSCTCSAEIHDTF